MGQPPLARNGVGSGPNLLGFVESFRKVWKNSDVQLAFFLLHFSHRGTRGGRQ